MSAAQIITDTINEFVAGILDAVPKLLTGFLFLFLAYVGIKLVTHVLRATLVRAYPGEQSLVADLGVLVATVFLWFGAGLTLLGIVGLGGLAASLGTAVGFVALGISYALSEMIEDTVAGVYLLKDPDFDPGDTVTAGSTAGVVTSIGLRKSRFELDSCDTAVVANRDVESKWTKKADGDESTAKTP